MRKNKYLQALQLLLQTKGFQVKLKKLHNEYNLPMSFKAIQQDFGVVKRWSDELVEERRGKGLSTNVLNAINLLFEAYKDYFPVTFRATFINFVMYGMEAVEEEFRLDGETPKIIVERSFKNKVPRVNLRIFADTTWNKDIEIIIDQLNIIQKGTDIFQNKLPGEKYKKSKKQSVSEENMTLFTKATSENVAELRIRIDGSTTYLDLRKTWAVARKYKKFLPEYNHFRILPLKKLAETLKILEMQGKDVDPLDQADTLWGKENKFSEDKKEILRLKKKQLRELRNKRYRLHKRIKNSL